MTQATVKFQDVDKGGVELQAEVSEGGYIYVEHSLFGAYEIQVEGKCRINLENGSDDIVEDSLIRKTLAAGFPFILADTTVELPDWDEAKRTFNRAKAASE